MSEMERLIQGWKAGKIQIYLENCNIGGGFKNRNFKRNVHDVFGRENILIVKEFAKVAVFQKKCPQIFADYQI